MTHSVTLKFDNCISASVISVTWIVMMRRFLESTTKPDSDATLA